ncbi:MAG: hypothetical protein LBI65_04350, partial [Candidatus Symbiothrix sp.]|nr:hypothetical protein [Candidatus Symbiothrix sp.]
MKTKETIRSEIIRFAQIAWQIKETNKLNPLVHLMIEEITKEIFTLTRKLEDTDYFLLEEWVKKLTPATFNYIRPTHAILRIDTEKTAYLLERETAFFVKNIPGNLEPDSFASLVFTPVTDLKLSSVNIRRLYLGNTLYALDDGGNREILFQGKTKARSNTIHLGLQIGEGIKQLRKCSFYLKFPHLNDNHEYYHLLPYLRWSLDGKELNLRAGFPVPENKPPGKIEREVLDYYHNHFHHIEDPVYPEKFREQPLPDELKEIINEEE